MPILDAWFGNIARVLQPGGSFYIWGGYANLGNYPPFLKKHGPLNVLRIAVTKAQEALEGEWIFVASKMNVDLIASHEFEGFQQRIENMWLVPKLRIADCHLGTHAAYPAITVVNALSRAGNHLIRGIYKRSELG
jgi:hypothetical protein